MNKINSIDSSLAHVISLPESQEKILLAINEQKTTIEKLLDKNQIVEPEKDISVNVLTETNVEEEKTKIDTRYY